MRLRITRRRAHQFTALASIEQPDDIKVGKSFDVSQAFLELGKDFESSLLLVRCSEATWYLVSLRERAVNEADGLTLHGVL